MIPFVTLTEAAERKLPLIGFVEGAMYGAGNDGMTLIFEGAWSSVHIEYDGEDCYCMEGDSGDGHPFNATPDQLQKLMELGVVTQVDLDNEALEAEKRMMTQLRLQEDADRQKYLELKSRFEPDA